MISTYKTDASLAREFSPRPFSEPSLRFPVATYDFGLYLTELLVALPSSLRVSFLFGVPVNRMAEFATWAIRDTNAVPWVCEI